MRGREELLDQIRHDVTELVEERTQHVMFSAVEARLQQRSKHTTKVPSLLEQLRAGLEPGADAEAAMGGAYGSRPALRSDCLDALLRIEVWSARWVSRDFGLRLRDTVEANLRALIGASTTAGDEDLRELARDVGHWWRVARTITGWDSPPWRPNVACMACERKGGLRVRLESKTAVCVECGETWDESTIGLLADHVRLMTGGEGDRGDTRTDKGVA